MSWPDLMTTPEAAAYLRWAPGTLRNKRTAGGGPPAVKAGRSVRYRKADLDRWLANNTQDRTPMPARRRAS